MLPFAFEDGMGYERYVDYALDVPMYFVRRDNRYIDLAGASFRDFLDGRLPQLPGEKPTLTDWADHLTTLFPEVRLKRFLEMRGADSGYHRACVPCPRSGPACFTISRASTRLTISSRIGRRRSASSFAMRCPASRSKRRSATAPFSASHGKP